MSFLLLVSTLCFSSLLHGCMSVFICLNFLSTRIWTYLVLIYKKRRIRNVFYLLGFFSSLEYVLILVYSYNIFFKNIELETLTSNGRHKNVAFITSYIYEILLESNKRFLSGTPMLFLRFACMFTFLLVPFAIIHKWPFHV